jgi:gas vesicle protein
MSDNTHGYTGFHLLMALAGGVALGAGVAYLTAPQSGSDTRHDILNRAEALRTKAAGLPHAIAGAFEASRDAFGTAVDGVREAGKDVAKHARS